MKITLNKQPSKFLQKQEQTLQLRIYKALQGLKEKPPIGDIKKLKGVQNTYRLRVGTYRVICTFDYTKNIVDILTIDNRGDIY